MTFLQNGRKAYYPHALVNIVSGNTPAASGHYIIDLFNRSQGRKDTYDADVAAGFPSRRDYKTSIPTDQSTGGIKTIAAYAGRIFFACSPGETGGDAESPKVGTFVLFSQLVDNLTDLEKCYQDADPTAEDISDLIDTDGGYIQLPDAINIKALVPFKQYLLVFADNGVWAIDGGPASAFTATAYQSQFLTNNGALSAESIVVTTDAVLYWSRNGIFGMGAGQGGIEIQSLTQFTIQKLYNAIPYNSKKYASGYFDDVDQRCRWLYQNTYDDNLPQRYTHELILDLSMPAWSKFTIKDMAVQPPRVTGYMSVPVQSRDVASTNYKYSTLKQDVSGTYLMTASYYRNTLWADWYSYGSGTDAAAYLVTGYIV